MSNFYSKLNTVEERLINAYRHLVDNEIAMEDVEALELIEHALGLIEDEIYFLVTPTEKRGME